MKRALLLLIASLYGATAPAQGIPDTDVFNGKWLVTIDNGEHKPRTARLQIANFAGTWISTSLLGDAKTKACQGKKVPVTVQVSQAETLEFTAWAAQVASACPDVSMTLHPVSERELKGVLTTGEAVTLKRP